jgi:hypothetical protein
VPRTRPTTCGFESPEREITMVEELEQEYIALKDKVRDLREYL